MKKKVLTCVLAMAMVLGTSPVTADAKAKKCNHKFTGHKTISTTVQRAHDCHNLKGMHVKRCNLTITTKDCLYKCIYCGSTDTNLNRVSHKHVSKSHETGLTKKCDYPGCKAPINLY